MRKETMLVVGIGGVFFTGVVSGQQPSRVDAVNVEIQTQFIAVPKGDADAALRSGGIPGREEILAWVKQGKATLVCAPRALALPGQEVTVKAVEEYIYPTALDVWPPQTNGAVAAPLIAVVSPANFETREVGVILSCLAELTNDGDISVMLSPELTAKPTWKVFKARCVTSDGKEREVDLEQPLFHSQSLSTSLLIKDGATVVAGGGLSDRSNETVVFVLVSARLVDASGSARRADVRVTPGSPGAQR